MRALLPLLFAGTLAVAQPNTAPPPDNGGLLVPEGYVLQVLGATDGRIAMPKGWFYTNAATPSGWQWTFSAEDPRAGAYETGLRIQMFMRVEQELKRSRESFATAFLEQRRKSAHVLRDCPIQDFGSFKRQCLEVLEVIGEPSGQKQFHILYTVIPKDAWVIPLCARKSSALVAEQLACCEVIEELWPQDGGEPWHRSRLGSRCRAMLL